MDKLNKKIIKNITLPFLCFPLLFSCGNNIDSVSKVNIDMGTLIGMDEEIKKGAEGRILMKMNCVCFAWWKAASTA